MRKPKIVVSKCLNSHKCRYDGQGYNNKVVALLKDHVDMTTVCPEVEIGLSIPRDPIRIEKHKEKEEYKLIQHNSNIDFTNHMNEFASEFITNLDDIDGFILKGKSPSCGIKDVKIYHQGNKCSIRNNGNGVFADRILEKYAHLPVENEGRLSNYSVRDNFFTKIFLINELKNNDDLIEFHKNNTMLLKSYYEDYENEMLDLSSIKEINDEHKQKYKQRVYEIISNKRKKETKLSIIENIFNKYKPQLKQDEIKMFNNLVKSYENQKIPFSSLGIAIRIYALRFNDSEVLNQTFFNPYPEELINISDSGKGRNL